MDNQRKKKRPANAPQKIRPPAQEVVYTAPEPLNRKKLILRLASIAAVALALFMGFSIFFKVENIVVSGNDKYTQWDVREASGIETGAGLLSFGKAKACGKITEALPYVKSVRIGITLPNTVNIYVEEFQVVYSAQDQSGHWWLITSDGSIVEKTSESYAMKQTIIKGVRLLNPEAGERAQVVEIDADATDESGEQIIVTVTNKERLATALEILFQLERNGILGKAASVDVSDMGNIELWYGSQYQVLLGNQGKIEEKIAAMKAAISQMGSHESGVLDISFTESEDKVTYDPF